ncbi:hypothetical protein O3P69_017614 [Scylla paramamosain]|uniref:Uncharacterized protein n=1 Tax=Scylla paramamosain TaxID=85552 RepID=A0AAW0TY60_SCYPA
MDTTGSDEESRDAAYPSLPPPVAARREYLGELPPHLYPRPRTPAQERNREQITTRSSPLSSCIDTVVREPPIQQDGNLELT